MTIAKKLILAAACIIGMQYSAYGYDCDPFDSYEVIMLKFSHTLQQIRTNKQALRIAQWLQDQVITQYYPLKWSYILAIVNVIENPTLTLRSKCTILTKIMTLPAQRDPFDYASFYIYPGNDSLSKERMIIYEFRDTLKQISNNKQSLRIAEWLSSSLYDRVHVYRSVCILPITDTDIRTIANIITNPNSTLESKCTLLTTVMAVQTRKAKTYKRQLYIDRAIGGIIITTIGAITALLHFMQEKNICT